MHPIRRCLFLHGHYELDILAFTHTLDFSIFVLTERCHQKPRTFQGRKQLVKNIQQL